MGGTTLKLVGFLAAPLLAGCSGGEAAASAAAVEVEASVRLVDVLHRARIESPLTAVDAVDDAARLEGVSRHLVFGEDFESDAWRDHEMVAGSDRGRSLVSGRGAFERWKVDAEPNTHYVFERLARRGAPQAVDLVVLEGRSPAPGAGLEGRPVGRAERVATRRGILRLHWPSVGAVESAASGGWQRGRVSFFTTPRTATLEIGLRARRPGPAAEAWFDEIRLWRLDVTAEQAMALLKADSVAPDAAAHHGIHKRGRFPPLGDPQTAHRPEHDNFAHRDALYAPAGTDIAFPMRLQRDAVLDFAVCLARQTVAGAAAHFEILARTPGGERTLYEHTLAAEPGAWRWHDERVDLTGLRGATFELVLRTRAVRGSAHPMWGSPIVSVRPRAGELRNVILIAVDTLRADRLGCYGYSRPTSPHLDALAADGVRFDQVASNATWTNPSFASIFTGTVVGRHRVWDWGSRTPLPRELDTLAERFSARGWATSSIVYKTPMYDAGFEQGFDVAFNVPGMKMRADDNLAEAMEWLESHAGRRSFLFLHFNDPHQPFNQPQPFDRTFGEHPSELGLRMPLMRDDLGRERERDDAVRGMMRGLYDGEVAYVDDRIGAFLEALKDKGLYDDAVIAFVSDHGEQLWEHGRFGHGSDMLHDEVVRVPLIVKPRRGTFAPGKVVAAQVMAFDVMPTLLQLAGIPVEDGLDAVSLTDLLAGGGVASPERIAVIDAWSHRAIAARTTRWKYILRFGRPGGTTEALFDLRADAAELEDVAAAQPDVVQRMRMHVLDHAMCHQPGHYLVLLDDGTERRHSVAVRGLSRITSLGGLPPSLAKDGAVSIGGTAVGPVVAAWQIKFADAVRVDGAADAVVPRAYQAGELARLVAEREKGVYLFECRARAANPPAAQLTEDLERLEAMRALGYVGDDPKRRAPGSKRR